MRLISHLWWKISQKYFPNSIRVASMKSSSVEMVITPSKVLPVLKFLKHWSSTKANILVDMACMDFLRGSSASYYLSYSLLNYKTGIRTFVYTGLPEKKSSIKSVTSVFVNANWVESEVYDMFGIVFFNHPRLTSMLTDYGFVGHPLVKTFPLTGVLDSRSYMKKGDSVWVLRGLMFNPEHEL